MAIHDDKGLAYLSRMIRVLRVKAHGDTPLPAYRITYDCAPKREGTQPEDGCVMHAEGFMIIPYVCLYFVCSTVP